MTERCARTSRRLGVGPIAVLAEKPSGATGYRAWRVIRPRRGALAGLLDRS